MQLGKSVCTRGGRKVIRRTVEKALYLSLSLLKRDIAPRSPAGHLHKHSRPKPPRATPYTHPKRRTSAPYSAAAAKHCAVASANLAQSTLTFSYSPQPPGPRSPLPAAALDGAAATCKWPKKSTKRYNTVRAWQCAA